jgi:tetratricopeptide (TPR) repeat protein
MNRTRTLLFMAGLAGCAAPLPAPDEAALERFEEANVLFATGRYADAAPLYASVIPVRDRLKDAYFKLATCHEKLGQEDRAVEVLEQLLRVDRFDEEGLRRLAGLRARKKQ